MGNYTNLCIMMHTKDTVMFLIMTTFFGEKVKRRDRRKDRFGDKSIKFFPILDPRSQRAGSYKIGAVIVNV